MDTEKIKNAIVTSVKHIPHDRKVPLHKHDKQDEIFYCIRGAGYGVLENSEVELTVGKAFIAAAGSMHALRSDNDLYVASFLVPVLENGND